MLLFYAFNFRAAQKAPSYYWLEHVCWYKATQSRWFSSVSKEISSPPFTWIIDDFLASWRLNVCFFGRDEKSQLLLGVRRANRQQAALPSSVLSADSMHIGVLAAANRSSFTIFYNPRYLKSYLFIWIVLKNWVFFCVSLKLCKISCSCRACPSEFVIPLARFWKSVFGTQLSAGMRFGMMFETEESSKRRQVFFLMAFYLLRQSCHLDSYYPSVLLPWQIYGHHCWHKWLGSTEMAWFQVAKCSGNKD